MSVIGHDTLKARRTLDIDGKRYDYFSLDAAAKAAGLGDVSRLPKPWKFSETFLFNDDRKFKPRTLDN